MSKKKLTQKRLKELFSYDPNTGIFTRKARMGNRVKIGDIAGCVRGDGYIRIMIDGVHYYSHRLVWLYIHSYIPENNLDHINRDPSDNRISNLREVSNQCNMRNTGNLARNTSGVKGVGWSKANQKWESRIHVNGKGISIGYYKSFSNAVCARLMGEQCANWSGCNSSSPAYQYVQKMLSRTDYGEKL